MTADLVIKILLILITSATGFCFWSLQRKITKRDAYRDKQEEERRKQDEARNEARKDHELLLIKSVNASIALGEATAQSVQRLDINCNGEMKKALEYAREVKHEQKDFLNKQGVCNFL